MAKRGNANAQQRREDFEHENDLEAADPGEGFNKASADVLKKRRIISISAKKKNIRGNAGAVQSGGGVFGNVNLQAKSSNPFGGVNLQANSSKPSGGSSLNPFGAVKQNSSTAPAPAQLPVWSAPKPAPPSSSSGTKLERLNASFIKWLQRQRVENPASDYSAGIQDYIKYASLALSESNPISARAPVSAPPPASAPAPKPAPAPAPVPAPAPAPSFNFNSGGAKSSPAKAPTLAPTPSFNFNGGTSKPTPAPAPASFSGFNFGGGSALAPAPAPSSAPSFSFSTGGAASAPAPAPAPPAAGEDGDSFPVEKPTELEKEENTEENLLLEVKAKYYRLKTGEGWKDRGVGNVKLYRHKTTSKCRLVMRNSIGKVGLNTSINAASQNFEKLGGKQSSCKFIIQDEEGMAQVMLKVKPENLDKLHSTLEAMK